jgi:tRNA pseudouridine38-40 synthase
MQAYIMPTFAFAPIEEIVTREYRMGTDIHEALNETLALFKGTHNFHNFTSRRPPQDPSCKRYITDFSSSKPFLVKDMEFVKITVKGN